MFRLGVFRLGQGEAHWLEGVGPLRTCFTLLSQRSRVISLPEFTRNRPKCSSVLGHPKEAQVQRRTNLVDPGLSAQNWSKSALARPSFVAFGPNLDKLGRTWRTHLIDIGVNLADTRRMCPKLGGPNSIHFDRCRPNFDHLRP